MIVSASYRTDIPAFYGDWFQARLDAGFVRVRSPYSARMHTVRLDPEAAAGFVFWTRNALPFLPVLRRLQGGGRPFVMQYTISGYGPPAEALVPAADRMADTLRRIAGEFGPAVPVWRYDPILLSTVTPADAHRRRFAALAKRLAGATDEVVVSFAQFYRKVRRNLAKAGSVLDAHDPDTGTKQELLADLRAIAAAHGIRLTLCTQPALAGDAARCIDGDRLARVAGRPFAARQKGNRPGCLCAESRDIGAYDTCPHGCVYCYAVADHGRARHAVKRHDPGADHLGDAATLRRNAKAR